MHLLVWIIRIAYKVNNDSRRRKCLLVFVHNIDGACNFQNADDHHHHHISFMELGHLLTRSGLTYPEVSSKVYHDSFCQLESCISLPIADDKGGN